jgi:hypothetical protein
MGGVRRVAMDVLGVVACYVCVVLGCSVMTSGGSAVFDWLYMDGSSFDVVLIALGALFAPLLWGFSLSGGDGFLGVPPVTLILPLACLLVCGLAGGIVGNRQGHPYRGFMVGVLPGMVFGAVLMAVLCHQMGVMP